MDIELLKKFENYLLALGQGLDYYKIIQIYLKYCDNHNINIYEIKYDQYSQFLVDIKQRQNKKGKYISNGRINNFIKAVRKFYVFLTDSQNLDSNILDTIHKFKYLAEEKKIIKCIGSKELPKIISGGITFIRRIKPEKMKSLIYFMFYTGLRSQEIVNLRRKNIDLINLTAVVKLPSKNKEERYVYFPEHVAKLAKRYFEIELETKNAFNVSYGQIRYLMKKLNEYMLLDGELTPHSLRHSFTNMLAEEEISVRVAQKLLGHKDMNSTLRYYNPSDKLIENIYHNHFSEKKKIEIKKGMQDGLTENL